MVPLSATGCTGAAYNRFRLCPDLPSDTPSDLAWFRPGPMAHNLLAAASWDGTVRVYEVQTDAPLPVTGQPLPVTGQPLHPATVTTPGISQILTKAAYNNNSPTLACTFIPNQAMLASGTVGKTVMLHNLQTGQSQQLGTHEGPLRRLLYWDARALLCSVSMDGVMKWWDLKSPQPVATQDLRMLICDADLGDGLLAMATEDGYIRMTDLNTQQELPVQLPTDFTNGYAVESIKIAGRAPNKVVCVNAFDGKSRLIFRNRQGPEIPDFTFRSARVQTATSSGYHHRSQDQIAAQTRAHVVWTADFNNVYNKLLTAGGDGSFYLWDIDLRERVNLAAGFACPIVCARFDPTGHLLALCGGNDWAKGSTFKSDRTPVVGAMPVEWAWLTAKGSMK